MTTVKFSLEEFQSALPQGFTSLGIVNSEYAFSVPIDDKTSVHIRSSIGESGIADSTGEDSIRVYFWNNSKKCTWGSNFPIITRIEGWEQRLNKAILIVKGLRAQASDCPVCGEARKILETKDHRWMSKCDCSSKWGVLSMKDSISDSVQSTLTPNPQHTRESAQSDLEALEQESKSLRKEAEPIQVDVSAFSSLNKFQLEFVNSPDGPRICEASPGSGKTKTMEFSVAKLIQDKYIGRPIKVGVFTFSQKAAAEARVRIAKTLWPHITQDELDFWADPKKAGDIYETSSYDKSWVEADPARKFLFDWVCTLHALSFRLLKSAGVNIRVISGSQNWELTQALKDEMQLMGWNDSLKSIQTWISRAILNFIPPHNSYKWFDMALSQLGYDGEPKGQSLQQVYTLYMDFMHKNKCVDFSMMVADCVQKLRQDLSFRAQSQALFDYILVDEAQDTDHLQLEILFYLSEKHQNLAMVGDCDQSLYRWRGAVPENMRENFTDHFTKSRRLVLPVNYRSTKLIVNTAETLINHSYIGKNEQYKKPFLTRDNAPEGDAIEYIVVEQESTMVETVIETIKQYTEDDYGRFLVLSRTRAECALIHTGLISNGIRAINKSGGMLFGSPYIRKVLAYARLACNYQNSRDNLEVLEEIANVSSDVFLSPQTRRKHQEGCPAKPWERCGCPIIQEQGEPSHTRFYGKKSIQAARSWRGIIEQQFEKNRGGYPTQASLGAQDLVKFVEQLEELKLNARQCISSIIERSIMPYLKKEEGISDEDLAENGKAEEFDVLLTMTSDDMPLADFLQKVDELSGEDGTDETSVLVGTVHWSKGAERDLVIFNTTRCPIIAPKPKEAQIPTGRPPTTEEERNIAYVAITRAKQKVYVVGSLNWLGMETNCERFIKEMNPQYKSEREDICVEALEESSCTQVQE